jgi:phosphopantothenate synthetase
MLTVRKGKSKNKKKSRISIIERMVQASTKMLKKAKMLKKINKKQIKKKRINQNKRERKEQNQV